MSGLVTFRVFPPEGSVFGSAAFASAIGRTLTIGDALATLRAVNVAGDGGSAELTVDGADGDPLVEGGRHPPGRGRATGSPPLLPALLRPCGCS